MLFSYCEHLGAYRARSLADMQAQDRTPCYALDVNECQCGATPGANLKDVLPLAHGQGTTSVAERTSGERAANAQKREGGAQQSSDR